MPRTDAGVGSTGARQGDNHLGRIGRYHWRQGRAVGAACVCRTGGDGGRWVRTCRRQSQAERAHALKYWLAPQGMRMLSRAGRAHTCRLHAVLLLTKACRAGARCPPRPLARCSPPGGVVSLTELGAHATVGIGHRGARHAVRVLQADGAGDHNVDPSVCSGAGRMR